MDEDYAYWKIGDIVKNNQMLVEKGNYIKPGQLFTIETIILSDYKVPRNDKIIVVSNTGEKFAERMKLKFKLVEKRNTQLKFDF